jgi:hypothetical protein
MALVQMGYVVTQTMDDARSGRNYRDLVQIVSKAQPIERLVPGGTVSDGILGSILTIWPSIAIAR